MAVWLGILFTTLGIAASEFFCINLSTIASVLGMSESMAGVTFLAFGNGSPDVFSTFAAMKINSGSLAVGELIGAASFIVAVVAGSMAIVRPFKVARRPFLRDILFFIVAILFGIFVLADGEIHMWECVIMVCYYIFYVVFVCAWHWLATRNKRIKLTDAHARDQYLPPGEEEAGHIGDDDYDGVGSTERSGLLRTAPDIRLLESQEDEDELEEEEQAVYVELSNNMRVTRSRSDMGQLPSVTPQFIRPSLVGALEFRSVLTSLKKSQNFGGRSIHLRRYSDNPVLHSFPLRYSAPGTLMHNTPTASLHESQGYFPTIPNPPRPEPSPLRARAVSVNDLGSHTYNHHYISQFEAAHRTSNIAPAHPPHNGVQRRETGLKLTVPSQDFLAPPGGPAPDTTASSPASSSVSPLTRLSPIRTGHRSHTGVGSQASSRFTMSPSIIADGDTSISPIMSLSEGHSYPPDGDMLRERLMISDADSGQTLSGEEPYPKWARFRYWPYGYLPPPQLIASELFPTLQGFGEKTLMGKLMALMALPSVFLLAITLPVVKETNPAKGPEPKISSTHGTSTPLLLEPGSPQSSAAFSGMRDSNESLPDTLPDSNVPPGNWNRWLHSLQCIFAPIFVTLVLFSDSDGTDTSDSTLVKPLLYALLVGFISLLLLQTLTSPNRPPKYRHLLCYLGFIVSISWISTIANEVVGVLKTIGVIFNISDAILGLTIFAMGNSLGDLVANITIAKLGFPVMALSACFGGPMLNILLGVGVSGMFIGWRRNGEGYKVEVSPTLVISAATLLITLVFLLVSVPMNGWRMSRRVGWVTVGLWSVSSVMNLGGEVGGLGKKVWGKS
ncbi:Sodium/calcium exchanger protein-domain-containing protein [Tirmania nivea]|nr:Sodium/calcium exchanger protein-domain-containing protein [Tirmania nivea]